MSYVAQEGTSAIVQLLLELGADIENGDSDNNTPLCLAAINGHGEVIKLLFDKGADVNVKNYNLQTPLELAQNQAMILGLLATPTQMAVGF